MLYALLKLHFWVLNFKPVIWQNIKLPIKEARRNAKNLWVNLKPCSASTWFYRRKYECQLFFLTAQGGPKELDNHFSIYSLVDTLNSNLIALNSIWATCDENSNFHVFKFKRKFSQSIRSKLIEPIKGYSGTQLYISSTAGFRINTSARH